MGMDEFCLDIRCIETENVVVCHIKVEIPVVGIFGAIAQRDVVEEDIVCSRLVVDTGIQLVGL